MQAFLDSCLFSDIFSTKTLLSPFVTSGMLSSVDSQHRWEVDHHDMYNVMGNIIPTFQNDHINNPEE